MQCNLHIVSGAPGAGKSTVVSELLESGSTYLIFDIDWLADAASELSDRDVYSDPVTWQPYGRLWFAVLHSVAMNGQRPIFFCPNTPDEIEAQGVPEWCKPIRWLLLDCDEPSRRERLEKRNWSEQQTEEALRDADELRSKVNEVIDTSEVVPSEVARKVLAWCEAGT